MTLRKLAFCALLASGVHGWASAEGGDHRLSVEWRDGQLSVDADRVLLAHVLAAIGGVAGVRCVGLENAAQTVSFHFARQSLADGLGMLLKESNHALVNEPSGDGTRQHLMLVIIGRKQDGGSMSVASQDGAALAGMEATAVTAPQDPYRLVELWAEQGDIAKLREAAAHGDSTTSALAVQRLARSSPADAWAFAASALGSDDSVRRVLAVQVLGGLTSVESMRALNEALKDSDATVRHAALVVLAGQPSASIGSLERAANDVAQSVRSLARQLLAWRRSDLRASGR